jgi:hypothetical protein
MSLSFWSIGSWGGSGFASLFGGMIDTAIGWRWIYIIIIANVDGIIAAADNPWIIRPRINIGVNGVTMINNALSFWSIGSWGGSGFASLFGGMIDTAIGWRWIYI